MNARRESLEQRPLTALLAIAGRATGQQWSRVMEAQHGLSATGASALAVLYRWSRQRSGERLPGDRTRPVDGSAGPTQAQLAEFLFIRPATLTGVVDTLVKADLVRRERDADDRRVVWLALTPAGEERGRQISAQLRRAMPPPVVLADPAHEEIIRNYLIAVITQEESRDDAGC